MMGYWGGYGGYNLVGTAFWIIILVDLTLLGVWLWKQINKK